jgi:hypothetical protein
MASRTAARAPARRASARSARSGSNGSRTSSRGRRGRRVANGRLLGLLGVVVGAAAVGAVALTVLRRRSPDDDIQCDGVLPRDDVLASGDEEDDE